MKESEKKSKRSLSSECWLGSLNKPWKNSRRPSERSVRLPTACLIARKNLGPTWVQLGSNSCQIRSKTVYHDAEQSQTDQQDRFFATALVAGGPRQLPRTCEPSC